MPKVSETIGSYRLGESLGSGGMGEVYRAVDVDTGEHVALKLLSAGLIGDEALARFQRECRLLSGLHHPHVVSVMGHGEYDGQPYLATELIEGTDLARLLADGPLGPADAVRLLGQIADALDAAHAAGVVHRDVKPANVLLKSGREGNGEYDAFLADFGIAKPLAADATTLTQTGEIGTLDYMAPERLSAGDVDGRADVYALACVLFECLTGKVPFPAVDVAGKLAAQLNDPPPAPSLFGRGIPAALDLVVATGMDKEPTRRYPTAGELMTAAVAAVERAELAERSGAAPAPTADPFDGEGVGVGVEGGAPTGRIMHAIVGVAQQGRDRRDTGSGPPDRCPYPGLRSFGRGEADLFCGRERAITELLVRLTRQDAGSGPLVVTGASGSGKSSLLRAGVLPALADDDSSWPQIVMSPGPRPIQTLAARLAPLAHADSDHLARWLREQPEEFGDFCARFARDRLGPDGRLVLVIDQFEELFTAVGDEAERSAFATVVASAWPALTIVAVRADFLEPCLRLSAEVASAEGVSPIKAALAHPFLLDPLGVADLERVITEPARLVGLELEPGLTERLVTDVGARDNADYDPGALPRLAHALRQTWENRSGGVLTLQDYQDTGGVDRAVAVTADAVYQRLPEAERQHLRVALLRLVTVLDGGGLARRRANREDLPEHPLSLLVEARLVTADADGVQLSHDALLTAWPRLREWVEEDRQGLVLRQNLDEAATSWENGGRDSGELYRGARLVAAQEWAAGRDDLTGVEQAFLQESGRAQRRTTRRLRATVATLAGLLVLTLIAGGLAVVARNQARDQEQAAKREASVASSRQLAAESLTDLETDPLRARRKALRAWRTSPSAEARGALISNVAQPYPVAFDTGVGPPSDVDVSPDGRYAALSSQDGRLAIIDLRNGRRVLNKVGHQGDIYDLEFSPDGRRLATVGVELKIWSVPGGKVTGNLDDVGIAVAWNSDGSAIATVGATPRGDSVIGIWDARSGQSIGSLDSPDRSTTTPFRIAFGANDTRIAVGRVDGVVELWNSVDHELIKRSRVHVEAAEGSPKSAAWVSFSDTQLASATQRDGAVRLWDPRTGKEAGFVVDPSYNPTMRQRGGPITFTPDGGTLLTSELHGRTVIGFSAELVNATTDRTYVQGPSSSPDEDRGAIVGTAVSREGDIVAASHDGSVRRWPSSRFWHADPTMSASEVTFDPRSGDVAAAAYDGLRSWSTTSGDITAAPRSGEKGTATVDYATDGTQLVGREDGTLIATAPDRTVRKITAPKRRLVESTISSDGSLVAAMLDAPWGSGNDTGLEIRLWERATGRERGVVKFGPDRDADSLQFTPDGRSLLALVGERSEDGASQAKIRRWRTSGMKAEPVSDSATDGIGDAQLMPDGSALITSTNTGRLRLRDAVTGKTRRTFADHPSPLRAIAVAPNGRTVATATTDEPTIRLWDVKTGRRIGQLSGHRDEISDLAFSPDSRLLASAGVDTDVGVWPVRPTDAADQTCADLSSAGEKGLHQLGC